MRSRKATKETVSERLKNKRFVMLHFERYPNSMAAKFLNFPGGGVLGFVGTFRSMPQVS